MKFSARTLAFTCIIAPTGAAAEATSPGDEAAVVVTATRFPEARSSLTVGAIVITGRQIIEAGIPTVPQALAKLGGIQIRNASGSPSPQIDLRGFGSSGDQNTLILVDGQRLSENEQASARLSAIPLESIDRIEILPGSGAVQYGGGATGGTVNIITKSPAAGRRSAQASLSLGSYATRQVEAGFSVAGEKAGLNLFGIAIDTDNYRENNAVKEFTLDGTARLLLDNGELRAKASGGRQQLGLPGPLTEAQIEQDPRQASTPRDSSSLAVWRALVGGTVALGSAELAADLGYRSRNSDADFASFGGVTVIDAAIWSFTPRLKLPFAFGASTGQLVAGIEWNDWSYGRTIDIPLFGFASDLSSTQTDLAGYFQGSLLLPSGLRLSAGGRLQRTRIEQRDSQVPGSSQSQSLPLSAFELGARQFLGGEQASIYGRWGQSFRTANVDDNGFTPDGRLLQPQKSHEAELGFEFDTSSAHLRMAAFQIDTNNEIHFVAIPSGGFFFGYNTNLPPTRRRGIELDVRWKLLPNLDVAGNYRFTNSQYTGGSFLGTDLSGNEVPLVPRQRASLVGTWTILDGLTLAGSVRYVGTQRYDNDQVNTFRLMPSYTLVDLKLSQQLGGWKLSAAVNNLFGENYYSYGIRNFAGTSFAAYPEPERSFLVTAEYALR
jgi:iron complex outermembrane receptor protein